ncbi:MAG: phage tail sheath C-terminal domain-containing protein, partial [Algoriphagus sp.]
TRGFVFIDQVHYKISPDPSTIYYLYLSVYLFYQNGGGEAYIVSVGGYGKPSGKTLEAGDPLVNPNVSLTDLLKGLHVLKKETEPTLYVVPEATLLPLQENAILTQEMLKQCQQLKTAISILDVPAGSFPGQASFEKEVENFRKSKGSIGLSYGAAYIPFLQTIALPTEEVNYTNLFGGDLSKLAELINPGRKDETLAKFFDMITEKEVTDLTVNQLNSALKNRSKLYAALITSVRDMANLLPPSGAIAGLITAVDSMHGVWKAPANVSLSGVIGLPFHLTSDQQAPLTMDATTGKSINGIRSFPGKGILVWGARTLDGNNQEFKYISVRRTVIFIEQSCKLAMRAIVFEPNVLTTWNTISATIGNFLTSLWREGGLAGAKSEQAFYVACGLGKTMTAQDILDGKLVISIGVAITRPAEFTVITLKQQMSTDS